MTVPNANIDSHYEQFWKAKTASRVYPTEFVVRTFLADYPELSFKKPRPGERILDVGMGDGRNAVLLCDLGLEVYGVEITEGIVEHTKKRLSMAGYKADLRVGRNSRLPFDGAYFDYLLACHSCYYCDEGETFADNMREYARVLKTGAFMIASVGDKSSYVLKGAEELADGSSVVRNDPYGNRNGYRLRAFNSTEEIENCLSPFFENFSIGLAHNNYFGIDERVFWVVCQKRGDLDEVKHG